jgi:hypothetical protein
MGTPDKQRKYRKNNRINPAQGDFYFKIPKYNIYGVQQEVHTIPSDCSCNTKHSVERKLLINIKLYQFELQPPNYPFPMRGDFAFTADIGRFDGRG